MGEGAAREVAAFLLDHNGFSGIPPTALVSAGHPSLSYRSVPGGANGTPRAPKTASLQLFAPHTCTTEELSHSVWPVDAVHRIAIFDIRTCNLDRNEDNILVRLVPHKDVDDGSVSSDACDDGGRAARGRGGGQGGGDPSVVSGPDSVPSDDEVEHYRVSRSVSTSPELSAAASGDRGNAFEQFAAVVGGSSVLHDIALEWGTYTDHEASRKDRLLSVGPPCDGAGGCSTGGSQAALGCDGGGGVDMSPLVIDVDAARDSSAVPSLCSPSDVHTRLSSPRRARKPSRSPLAPQSGRRASLPNARMPR